jgi:hypothetical protein
VGLGALALAFVFAACGDDPPLLVEPQSTESPEVVEPTYPGPSETPVVTPEPEPTEVGESEGPVVSGQDSPEAAAQGLYASWSIDDSAGATAFATAPAIEDLFATEFSGDLEFIGCEEQGLKFGCFYYYEGGGLNLIVRDSDAGGYLVTRAFFVAD